MYAIVADSGKQFRVEEGQLLEIDYREAKQGDTIQFNKVLAVSRDGNTQISKPVVAGARVTAEVLGVKQGKKLVVQKLRRRKNFRRKTGHRQNYVAVKVQKITV